MALKLDRILEQTRKLIALAGNNPSEEEARSAARRACVLILTHGFTVSLPGNVADDTIGAEAPTSDYADLPPDWREAVGIIEGLATSWEYQWAWPTLDGIKTWVVGHQHITPKQWRAIRNIERARR